MDRNWLSSIAFMSLVASAAVAAPSTAPTEEQQLAKIATQLKPISDEFWNEIAGSKQSEMYDIQKGDTLWDISQRLFGNANYWPKVWALNSKIGNPHIVSPGEQLSFTPGSSSNLPKLEKSSGENSGAPLAEATEPTEATYSEPFTASGTKKKEYEKIHPNKWAPETYLTKIQTQQQYDEMGIDKELKISIPRRFVFRVPALANDTTIPSLGEVVASRRDGKGLTEQETIFLSSNDQDLQVGTTYSVLSEPQYVRERKADRTAYLYNALGEVRIVGVRDDLYIGKITRAFDIISRGDKLYPLLPLIDSLKPVAAPNLLESLVITNSINNTTNIAQFRYIHFDRGIEDGVQIGNVFRVYAYDDPITQRKITDSDFLVVADALVVHSTAQFSTALVIRSRETFTRGDFGVLLTDVSDLEKQMRTREKSPFEEKSGENASPIDKELDELDELDRMTPDGLGTKEEKEIKELDYWDRNQEEKPQTPPELEPIPESQSPESPEPETEPTLESTDKKSEDSELDSSGKQSSEPPASETEPALEPSEPVPSELPPSELPPSELPSSQTPEDELGGGADPNAAPEKEAAPVPKVEGVQPAMPDDVESPTGE